MDILKEHNHQEIINSYTLSDWKPLLDLIPRIENQTSFSKRRDKERSENNNIIMPLSVEAPIVGEFREIVYQLPVIIDFDWPHWDEGRKMAKDEHFDYDSVDIPTKCKVITAFVRNDRFCDGALAGAFERGTILKILKSIERQISMRRSV
jgi:hypothetical protein